MAVSVAVCEIFSIKEWCDLENRVRVRSRSSEMTLLYRSYATFYWSYIVNVALSCTILRPPKVATNSPNNDVIMMSDEHRKWSFNKNLAIANRSRVSCAHNTLRASIGINITR